LARGQGGPNMMLAMYQLGSLICEYLDATHGFPKIAALLKAWGEGQSTDQAFQSVVGQSVSDFSRDFANWLKTWVEQIKLRPPVNPVREQELRARLATQPEDAVALAQLARIMLDKDTLADAKELAGKALAIDPNSIDAHYVLAMIHYKNRRFKKAAEEMRQAIAAGADEYSLHYRLAEILHKDKEDDAAIAEFEAAKRCFPRYVGTGKKEDNPYVQLAAIYDARDEPEKAEAELAALVAIDHDDVKHRLQLAKIYRQKGDLDRLIAMCREAIYIEPRDILIHQYLGEAHRTRKEWPQAAQEFTIAIALLEAVNQERKADRFIADFHCEVAEAMLEMGKRMEAREHANTALQFVPDLEQARAILKSLE
jgi:tetratricopeptide (TPR) repeat protein